MGINILYTGHGDSGIPAPPKIAEYIQHRLTREQQILDGLSGEMTAEEIVMKVYGELSAPLYAAALHNTNEYLGRLEETNRVIKVGDKWKLG